MNRAGVVLILLLAHFGAGSALQPAALQTLPLSELSGAVNIGNDRVLLVADEGFHVELVSGAQSAFETAVFEGKIGPLSSDLQGSDESKKKVDDLEDIAWDPVRGAAFAITSHSRSKKQDSSADPKADKPGRHKLVRLMFKDGTFVSTSVLDVLGEVPGKFPFIAEAMKKGHQEGGEQGTFNIEGLAFDPSKGRLLIGLRSPTQSRQGKPSAVVYALENPHALFDSGGKAVFSSEPMFLDLGGLGIRGMTYDPDEQGLWIVAGRSADPDDPTDHVLSSVWFWDPADVTRPPRNAGLKVQGLENLESVSLLARGTQKGLLLISDDGDKSKTSRYLWVPVPSSNAAAKP